MDALHDPTARGPADAPRGGPPQPPLGLAARRGARRQRRPRLDGEPRAGRRGVRRVGRGDPHRRRRRAGGRRAVDGGGRVRVGQLAARRRAGRPAARGARAAAAIRAASCASWPGSTSGAGCRPRWRARSPSTSRAATRWARTPATSSASTRSGWRGRCRPHGRRRSSFSAGAVLPLLAAAVAPARGPRRGDRGRHARRARAARRPRRAARRRGARRATVRVVAWGAVAMAVTAGIGALVGAVA